MGVFSFFCTSCIRSYSTTYINILFFFAWEISNSLTLKIMLPSDRHTSTILDMAFFSSIGNETDIRPLRATKCSETFILLLCSTLLMSSLSLSKAKRRIFTTSGAGTISWLRISPNMFSILWASSFMVSRPKKPPPPLIEWAARKTLFTSSRSISAPASSIINRSFSTSANCSRDSSTYNCKVSSSWIPMAFLHYWLAFFSCLNKPLIFEQSSCLYFKMLIQPHGLK